MAKEWFARAEAAEAAGDEVAAIKAYACSMKMVPHAYTTYNLGRLAERTGDLELALGSYRDYLVMQPAASDRPEVEKRIKALEERIAAIRQRDSSAEGATASSSEPATEPKPEPTQVTSSIRDEPPSSSSSAGRPVMGLTEWAIAGAAVAALGSGIALNLGARRKMDDCRSLATGGEDLSAAQSACDKAKPFAYSSYGLLGVAALAAAVDVALIWRNSSRETVSIAWLPGGASVNAFFRF